MSIHVQITKEAVLLLRQQERKSRALSVFCSCLALLLLAMILALFALPMVEQESPIIVTYSAQLSEEPEVQEKKTVTQITRQPSAPAPNLAKVIASSCASSPVSIPVPDIAVPEPSLHFGDDVDFGDGWGDEVLTGGAASFFGQQVKANRIAYVIDYSLSMRGEREKLMREELAKSVEALPPGVLYQLIFFAGPVWVAGDKIIRAGRGEVKVVSNREEFIWKSRQGTIYDWDLVGQDTQAPEWRDVTSSNIAESLEHIKKSSLTGGTAWLPPIEMALKLNPPPQVIYFMTDGLAGPKSNEIARKAASLAVEHRTIVNTVALMEPKAREAMMTLAHESGGSAVLIDQAGERHSLDK